jgi:hypothetical protein
LKKIGLWEVAFVGLAILMIMCPDMAHAQFAGDLQAKVNGVTSGLITFLLPAASTIGLIYSAILAASGDASAKQRMTLIIICSVVGMLAPLIIRWLQGMAN